MKYRLSEDQVANLLSLRGVLKAARLKHNNLIEHLHHDRLKMPEEGREPIEQMIDILTVFDLSSAIDRIEVALDPNRE